MTEVPDADRGVGMLVYATTGPPCSGRAKATDDDFRVEERLDLGGLVVEQKEGYFPLYRAEKRDIDTLHLEREVSSILKSRVSFGGLKDKRSASAQYFTPTSRRAKVLEAFEGARFKARLVGYLPRPVGRTSVAGNSFRVVIRDCCPQVESRAEEALAAARERLLPNFFGLQRFGSRGASHLVGKAIVKRRFEDAVNLILEGEEGPVDFSRAKHAAEGDAKGDVEALVAKALMHRQGDWVGALRAVPIRLRRLYVHAFQSYLFNLTLSRALEDGESISRYQAGDNWAEESAGGLTASRARGVRDTPSGRVVPLVQLMGFAFRNYGSRFDARLLQVASDQGVEAKEFYLEEMQEVSAEGGFRRPHLVVEGESVAASGPDATLCFTLGRGMYATVLLREVMKPSDPEGAGLG